ncbi:hypothetical protein BHYA_0180g00030 [Botrytis hyacinthi]|uniref:Uncharacterized protein n=1 Tax=Botrytis hyacinthi TaxID=278943 RepID=A0A4Z1GM73_9HELO|nr:hypothetical protein BHYA_0180g00030 [Botrytis hyacinthi]
MTSGASRTNSGSDGHHADSKPRVFHRSSHAGSTRVRTERRRSIESPGVKTQDLNIGGRDPPQPSLGPRDTGNGESSVDTKLRDLEIQEAALEKIRKHNKGQDSEAGDSQRSRRRRRSLSHHNEKPIEVRVRYEEKGKQRSRSPPDRTVTKTQTKYTYFPLLNKLQEVEITHVKERRPDRDEHHEKPPSSDRMSTDSYTRSDWNRKNEDTDRKTKHSSRKGSDVSSREKSERKSKSATSSKHRASTDRSAGLGDNDNQAPRAESQHGSRSSNSQNAHEDFDDEPSPGGPKALSGGPTSGPLDGRLPRSNTAASDSHSLSGRDLKSVYKPNRGGEGPSTPAHSNHGAERTQIGYGRNDENNEPYAREIRRQDRKSSGPISSKVSIPTSTPSNYEEAERTQIYCGRNDQEDEPYAREIERDQSNMSASRSHTSGGRRAGTRTSNAALSNYNVSEQARSFRREAAEDESSAYENRTNQSEISASRSHASRDRRSHRS